MDRRQRWMLSATIGALAVLLLSLAPSADATPGSPSSSQVGMVAALVKRLVASPRILDLAPVASASHTKLPPDLIALERKMRALRINSERGSVVVSVAGVSLRSFFKVTASNGSGHRHTRRHGRGSARRGGHERRSERLGAERALELLPSFTLDTFPLLTADFESSVSPKLEIVRAEFLGAIPLQLRVIGERTYTRNPFVGLVDAGKPWVYESARERSKWRILAGSGGRRPGRPRIRVPKAGRWPQRRAVRRRRRSSDCRR